MEDGRTCSHCDRVIAAANYDLHIVHCQRNLERCTRCGEMVARARSAEHFDEVHAPVPCTLCGEKLEVSHLPQHKLNQCPKREVICPYCEFSMPAEDSIDHEYFCGSRTDICVYCNKYITNRERLGHDIMVHGFGDGIGDGKESGGANSSREEVVEVRRGSRGEHRQSSSFFGGRLFVSAALGTAILLASAYLGRRSSGIRDSRASLL